MTWRFFFKRFVPAAVAFAAVWVFRDEIDNFTTRQQNNG